MQSLLKGRVLAWFALLVFPAANAAPPAGFTYQPIGSQWNEAVGVTFAEDGGLFVMERAGRVWRVNGTTKSDAPFLDIAPEVGAWRDNGMLGFALHPNFRNNGYIYVAYVVDRHHLVNCTEPASGTGAPVCTAAYSATTDHYIAASIARVTRYTAVRPAGDSNFLRATRVDDNSRKVLVGETPMTGCPVLFDAHTVGGLAFGDDSTLFVACGDAASSVSVDKGRNATSYWNLALRGTPQIIRASENVGAYRAQLTTSLSGKILRLDPLTGNGVSSNPLYDAAVPRSPASRLWALGLRNPFRISHVEDSGHHDPMRGNPGTLLIGDVGWLGWDEFHVSRTGGENFGWPYYEGMTAHTGYVGAITYNRDAPNPLFGIGGCAQQFFAFQDLIKPDTLNAVSFTNACNAAVAIPATVPTWVHRRPEVDWSRSGTARWSTFDALGNPVNNPIGQAGVSGQPFAGTSSTAGVFYTGSDFPASYKNTYFHADYGANWIRNFKLNGNFKPLAVDVFDDAAGPVVGLATNPVSGGLYFVLWNGGVHRVVYGTGNQPPTAVIAANRAHGTSPLTVVFSGAGSRDPEGQPLTYRWDFGDGTATSPSATSAAANPSHSFNAGSSAPQSFNVSLRVTDQGGLAHTATHLVSANNTPPVVAITTPADGTQYSLAAPTSYRVSASVLDNEHSAAQIACSIRLTLHHNSHHHDDPSIPACQADVQVSPLGCGAESYYWRIAFTAIDAAGLIGYDEVLLAPNCPSTTLNASAGPDRSVVDGNGDGNEVLLLDGSASTDSNGTIASYTWYRNGGQLATGATANVSFGVGVHQVRLEVLNSNGVQAADTAQVTVLPAVTTTPNQAELSGAAAPGPVVVNLTTTGTVDWVNWGLANTSSVIRKRAVTPQIGGLTAIGPAPARFGNDPQWNTFNWTDGTPTLSKTNVSSGLYFAGLGNGYRLTVPANTNRRTLKLYVGGWASTGEIRATLSDGSVAPYVATISGAGVYSRIVTLVFAAASNGQSLAVTHTHKSGNSGNVGVQAAALVEQAVVANVAPTLNPIGDKSVEAGSPLTFTVTANDPDSPLPPAMTLGGSAPTLPVAASYVDNGDGTGRFTWTPTAAHVGTYAVTFVARDGAGLAAQQTMDVGVTALPAGGSLTGDVGARATSVNLTAVGSTDWIVWGLATVSAVVRKAAVAPQISGLTPLRGAAGRFGNDPLWSSLSWTDGTPTPTRTKVSSGVYFAGIGSGYRLTVPADAQPRTLKLYVGGWASTGEIRATLSDGSAAPYVATVSGAGVYPNVVTLVFRAANNGQTLTVTHTHKSGTGGNVGVQAATLAK